MLVFFKLMPSILYFEEEFSQMSFKNKVGDEETHLNKIVGTLILKLARPWLNYLEYNHKFVKKPQICIEYRPVARSENPGGLVVLRWV